MAEQRAKHFDVESLFHYLSTTWVWKYASSFHRCRFSLQIRFFDYIEYQFLFLFFYLLFLIRSSKRKIHSSQLGERNKDWNSWILVKRVSLSILLCQKKTRKKTRYAANCTGTPNALEEFTIYQLKSARYRSESPPPKHITHIHRDAPTGNLILCIATLPLLPTATSALLSYEMVIDSVVRRKVHLRWIFLIIFLGSFHQLKLMTESTRNIQPKTCVYVERQHSTEPPSIVCYATATTAVCCCRMAFCFGERFRWRPTTTMRTIRWRCRGNRMLASLRVLFSAAMRQRAALASKLMREHIDGKRTMLHADQTSNASRCDSDMSRVLYGGLWRDVSLTRRAATAMQIRINAFMANQLI